MTEDNDSKNKDLKEAYTCSAIGVGIGAAGTGAALITGAVCPICIVAAPALIGVGLVKRFKIKKSIKQSSENS